MALSNERSARLGNAIDRAFGESFTFLPFTASSDVDLPKIPDTSRAAFTRAGAFEDGSKSMTPQARGAIQDDNAHNWTTSLPSVSVQDALMPWRPKMGDRVRREKDGTIWEVGSPAPNGDGRTLFPLTAKKIR